MLEPFEPALRPAPSLLPPAGRLGAAIAGLGVAVPEALVSNAPIAARLGVAEDWIVQRTGVRERRVAAPEERLCDFAALAAARALPAAGLEPRDLDLVLVATFSNDELTPARGAAGRRGAGRRHGGHGDRRQRRLHRLRRRAGARRWPDRVPAAPPTRSSSAPT